MWPSIFASALPHQNTLGEWGKGTYQCLYFREPIQVPRKFTTRVTHVAQLCLVSLLQERLKPHIILRPTHHPREPCCIGKLDRRQEFNEHEVAMDFSHGF